MTSIKTSLTNRIEIIDVLRGFALFGIVLIHMIEQYYAGQAPANIPSSTIADHITSAFGAIFIMGKFFMIFSFLFGLSFYIQFSKSDAESNFLIRFSWRLLLLFAIGMLHHLHYRGDILSIYAILGFALLLLHRLPDRALLALALILIFNIPALVTRSVQVFFPPESNLFDQDQETLLAYYNTVKNGSYFDILKINLTQFGQKMEFQLWSGRIYITLGLFLLGIYAGRKKFFENLLVHTGFVKTLLKNSGWSLLGCFLLGVSIFGGAHVLKIQMSNQLMWAIGGIIMDVANTALFVIYLTGIILLFQKPKWNKALMYLYPVGRMGLTTYLMQTLFGTLIMFSYGLGLLFELGAFYSFLLGLAIFGFQILFAQMWFRYFTYGPVEWMWRNLTYFKMQKITMAKPAHLT